MEIMGCMYHEVVGVASYNDTAHNRGICYMARVAVHEVAKVEDGSPREVTLLTYI